MDFEANDICKYAAINLYRNGNDHRQVKNGNPDKLIEKALSLNTIATVGVYKNYLSNSDRQIICDPDKTKCETFEFISKMAKAVLQAYATMYDATDKNSAIAFVRFPKDMHRDMMIAVAAGDTQTYKFQKIVQIMSPRKMFIYQERQKVSG